MSPCSIFLVRSSGSKARKCPTSKVSSFIEKETRTGCADQFNKFNLLERSYICIDKTGEPLRVWSWRQRATWDRAPCLSKWKGKSRTCWYWFKLEIVVFILSLANSLELFRSLCQLFPLVYSVKKHFIPSISLLPMYIPILSETNKGYCQLSYR